MARKQSLDKVQLEKVIGQPVSSFTISSGSNQGDNVGGSLLSLKVTTGNGENLSLIYKCQPLESNDSNDEDSHYVVKHRIKSVFRIETCMYEKIFPLLEQLCNSKLGANTENARKLELPIPKYISGHNDDFKNDYICLEDLRPKEYKMQDKYESLTVPEVSLVMKEIAKFHALTYSLIRFEGEKIVEEDERITLLKYNCLTEEDSVIGEVFSRMFKCYFENTAELLRNHGDEDLAGHIQQFTDKHDYSSFHSMRRMTHNRTDKTIFPCIIHGDLWTNNILFKYADNHGTGYRQTPTQLKLIDFQLSRRSNVYDELGYFFWTSTTPDFRETFLENMLETYYVSFKETLDLLQVPMPVGFTRGNFIDGFYESVLPAYMYMPFALSLQMMGDVTTVEQKDEKSYDKQFENEKETGAMTTELWRILGKDKTLHMLRMSSSPEAVKRLTDLTREIVKLKLI